MNFKYKTLKVAIVGSVIVLAGMIAVFVYTKNQQNISEELPPEQVLSRGQDAFVPIGDVKQTQLTLDNGDNAPMFIQAYNLRDANGSMIDLSSVKAVKMKYPGGEKFFEVIFGDTPKSVMFNLVIWPQENLGEYIFRIEYEDGTIREETVNWQGVINKSFIETQETRIESDGIMSRAYKVEGVDLSSFREMFYIRPDSAVTRMEASQDEYFWLKTSDTMLGNHTLLIKKEGAWYQSGIFITGKKPPGA